VNGERPRLEYGKGGHWRSAEARPASGFGLPCVPHPGRTSHTTRAPDCLPSLRGISLVHGKVVGHDPIGQLRDATCVRTEQGLDLRREGADGIPGS
jgi:hypothetical protein